MTRTPMNGLLGMLELLSRSKLEAPVESKTAPKGRLVHPP